MIKMKRRILSIFLALCLCGTSQSTVYAQDTPLQPEDILTKETADKLGDNEDENTVPVKDTPQPKEEPDSNEAEDTVPAEGTSQPEESQPKDTSQPEEDSQPENDTSQPAEDSADEPTDGSVKDTDESDSGEDVDMPQPTQEQDGEDEKDTGLAEDFTEKMTDELDSSEAESNDLLETLLLSEEFAEEVIDEPVAYADTIPTPTEVYNAMIALRDQDGYREGTTWTDDTNHYDWNGGPIGEVNITATGCVAFAFELSDRAFGSLPNRMYSKGGFSYEEIRSGDILRMNGGAHTVIVLEVTDAGVIVAEGNYSGKVHWGRTISREEVMSQTSSYITRYPEGYVSPDDPTANDSIASDTFGGGFTYNLTKAGTLTISGSGAMPDFDSAGDQPWNSYNSQIRKIVIGNGITSVGSCAFWNCEALSVEIPSGVTAIGRYAFRESSLVSVSIPSSVKTIGDSAFHGCGNLVSVNVAEGVEVIEQNAFRACRSLTSIALPASVEQVGAASFMECDEMTNAVFAPGSKQVRLGDNIFMRCYRLMNVTLPKNADRIGEGMFMNCGMLKAVEIPQGVERIEQNAFASCAGLIKVVIPDSVTAIGISAFDDSSLTDIYFTGSEAQWNSISKLGDTSVITNATKHFNYVPDDSGDDNNNSGGDDSNNSSGDDNRPGGDDNSNSNGNDSNHSDKDDNSHADSGSDRSGSNSASDTAADTWKPTTPDEVKRYDCVGKEIIQYAPSQNSAYQVVMKNAVQGPMCFQSFEAVLGDYTIGRTYNIFPNSRAVYSMDEEIELAIKIPPAIYRRDREYRLICVTEGGLPIIYDDLDDNPDTITIKTNKFHAYALVYK